MRTNRFSLACLLAFIFVVCAPVGEQIALAQRNKSCDDPPIVRPAPRPAQTPVGGTVFGPPPPSQRVILQPIWEPFPPLGLPPTPAADPLTNPLWTPGQPLPALENLPVPDTLGQGQGEATDYKVINKISVVCAELLEPSNKLTLASIDIGGQSIPIISFRGLAYPYYNNSIYIHHSNVASPEELTRMVEVNKSFIEALGPRLFDDPALNNARYITTAKSASGEFVTVFEVKNGKFGGAAMKLEAPVPSCHSQAGGCTMADALVDAIGPWLKPISEGGGRLYLVGDDLDLLDPTDLARRFNCEVLRRSPRIVKGIKETESRLAQLQTRRLEAEKTVYINGLPRNEVEAVNSKYQRIEVGVLQRAAADLDGVAKQFFDRQSLTPFLPRDLQELFTSGESDVVIIVAHADKERIYLNGTPVSIDEIKNYPDRTTPSSRPRVCILLSCHGANFRIEKGWWLSRREIESLAEVLVRKGYFDKVVAPRGEITAGGAVPILRDFFSGRLIREIAADHYQQLLQTAELRKRAGPDIR